MRHLDLFSGIGGFAYAVDQVWDNVEHIFCDNDKFCEQITQKHWKGAKHYGDIRTITADSEYDGGIASEGIGENCETQSESETGENLSIPEPTGVGELRTEKTRWDTIDLVTGGFPCQPFSQAGKRKGTDDNRFLWPEMLRVIQLTKPQWVIAENVRGILTIEGGVVFEQVCLDLEASGYEVQPFIIPAVAVNAPHRRDRVWIVARNTNGIGLSGEEKLHPTKIGEQTLNKFEGRYSNAPDTRNERLQGRKHEECSGAECGWNANWVEVATGLCRVDDGLSKRLVRLPDGRTISRSKWRQEALKAYGNAIVPQVALEILKAIKEYENPPKKSSRSVKLKSK
jgi:DNA (cytosine-5)-methyltransferase 1